MTRKEFEDACDAVSEWAKYLSSPVHHVMLTLRNHDAEQRAEIARLATRLRTTAQLGIAEIGADGPEDAESVVGRLVARIHQLQAQLATAKGEVWDRVIQELLHEGQGKMGGWIDWCETQKAQP